MLKLIPQSVKVWFNYKIEKIVLNTIRNTKTLPSVEVLKYIPYRQGHDSYTLTKSPQLQQMGADGLPIPPKDFWQSYADTADQYLASGEKDLSMLRSLIQSSGLSIEPGHRILDFGCANGRMIRHWKPLADTCEIWGTDIRTEQIYWCKQNLTHPFRFAATTTIPHLPFEDGYFNLIYAGSVFTHIDDLADAWLLELRRVLAKNGRLYITIHDKHTVELLETSYNNHPSSQILHTHYSELKSDFQMVVLGRDTNSDVFYDLDYFCGTLNSIYQIISITPEAYGYQTAIVLAHKPAAI